MKRSKRGFTLVEMVVAMAASSIVVLAGMSFVTVCLRIQGSTYTEVSRQDTARVALTLVETMAGRGELKPPTPDNDGNVAIKEENDSIILYYDNKKNTVYVGGELDGTGYTGGTPLMQNAELNVLVDDRLLTVTLKDKKDGEPYSTTVFCREWERQPGPYLFNETWVFGPGSSTLEPEKKARYNLLEIAMNQFGSDGHIIGDPNNQTFASWYSSTWNDNTAWCACFVSWCIQQEFGSATDYDAIKYLFGDVVNGWNDTTKVYTRVYDTPIPGDLIFFDNSGDKIADHVGFVLKVETDSTTSETMIYTVEGNNNGLVVIAKYNKMEMGEKILGYAKLPWEKAPASGT